MIEQKSVHSLVELATAIGWKKVAEDKDFTSYEYKKDVSRSESVTYLLRIFEHQESEDFYQTLFIINNVLPRELKKKIKKITKKIKMNTFHMFSKTTLLNMRKMLMKAFSSK